MKKWMEVNAPRRILSLALSAAMVLSLLPVFAIAEEDCPHHPAHTPECGYVKAVEGQDCTHVCGDECFTLTTACTHVHGAACYGDGVLPAEGEDKAADACTHSCTEESGCVTRNHTCVHTAHDGTCGYVAAVAGQPCGFVCTECGYTGWVEEDGNWYYLTEGVRQTGWQNGIPGWEGKWLYFDPETGAMQTGWQNGIAGWEGKWFYFDPETGVMQTDLQSGIPDYVDAWYYLDPETGAIQTGGEQNHGNAAPAHGCVSTLRPVAGDEGELFWACPVCGALLDAQGNELPAIRTYTSGTFNGSPAEVDEYGRLLINETNFPDGRFREIVKQYDKDSSSSLSTAEVAAVNEIECVSSSIGSLKGIEYFTALTQLECGYNQLTELDVSNNTALTQLECGFNQLTELDVSNNTALTNLGCGGNQLKELDVSNNRDLTHLDCGFNQLTSLDVGKNKKLTILGCQNNNITSLDVSSLPDLHNLFCRNNALTSLDLGSNPSLNYKDTGKQNATGEYIQRGGEYVLDMAKVVGAGNLSRVRAVSGGSYDSATGMVTLDAPVNGKATFQYNYDTQKGSMDVTLTLSAHTTHSFDESGACACGLVKRVPYVDAQGEAQTPQVCTVITKDTKTLTAGWYVASGSVTDDHDIAIRRRCDGDVNLILEDGCNLDIWGAIDVSSGNSLTIYAQSTGGGMGKLTVTSGESAYLLGEDSGAGIGSSDRTPCGSITINGGIITTVGTDSGAGIGSGKTGSGGSITISGGIVTAASDRGGVGIGNDVWSSGTTFSTGTNGNPVIFTSSISDKSSQSSWSGVIFEGGTIDVNGMFYEEVMFFDGGAGKVYGNPTMPLGLPIPKRSSLTLDMNSNSLTFAEGTGITLGSGSTLKLSGPGSFPGGISVSGGTLAGLLAEGWAFTQNGKCVPVSDETSLSGATDLSSVTVTITTQPVSVTMTYGEAKSLSVTATPTTSGSTVSYQWYLDGSALPGETKSTLSLSTLNAGSHIVYCAVTCDGFTVDSGTATVTVGKAAGSVSITGDPGKTYDGTEVSMEGKYTTSGTGKVEYKLRNAADSTYSGAAPKKAGDYTVRVTAEDTNHTAASETKDFTVTPKEVTLTVTVKDKTYDKSTTAEIDTVTPNGIVSGDSVQVVNGIPTFARSTPGAGIPVRFTEFSLTGADAGNYVLTQPTGVTGSILATGNYLDLANSPDFAGRTEVWIDGVKYPIQTENGCYVDLPEEGDLLTIYTYKQGSAHGQYPTGMAVYRIDRQASGATVTKISALDNLLQYSGCSIRVTGKRGIRMITSLTKGNKSALTGAGLAGYTLEEYGTVVQWADTLGSDSLTLTTGKHNYAYKKGAADPVFHTTGSLTQYTNVLVWESLTREQLGKDIVMRPYIILSKDGKTVTLYGGTVSRSIGYIAYQNRNVFNPGTAEYKYVWDIIHAVYGKTYDKDYKG